MMNFIDMDYQNYSALITNIQHNIKYNSEDYYGWLHKIEVKDKGNYSKEQFKKLCIMATVIQVAYSKVDRKPPEWVLDKRLFMGPPYVDECCTPFDIFEAYQAEYDHNVFFNKTFYEVI